MGIDHIDIEPIGSSVPAITLWAVSMPSDRDRDKYIKSCFSTSTISIANSNGQRVDRVPIPGSLLREIYFPTDTTKTGSLLLCGSIPYSRKLFVIQSYNDASTYSSGSDNVAVFKKYLNGKIVEIVLDANTGSIDLNVDSDTDGGEVNITVSNQSRTGTLNITVNGDVNLLNDGNVNVKSSKQISLQINDDSTGGQINSAVLTKDQIVLKTSKDQVNSMTMTKDQITLKANEDSGNAIFMTKDKIQLNESTEPMLLGQKTVQLISDLLDQLAKESAGPYPLLGNSVYTQIKSNIEALKSTLSFVK